MIFFFLSILCSAFLFVVIMFWKWWLDGGGGCEMRVHDHVRSGIEQNFTRILVIYFWNSKVLLFLISLASIVRIWTTWKWWITSERNYNIVSLLCLGWTIIITILTAIRCLPNLSFFVVQEGKSWAIDIVENSVWRNTAAQKSFVHWMTTEREVDERMIGWKKFGLCWQHQGMVS